MAGPRVVGRLVSGESVFDRPNPCLRDFSDELVREGLGNIQSRSREYLVEEIEFSRRIGFTSCVVTTQEDEIVFSPRLYRAGLTRFVLGRKPEPCKVMLVTLKRATHGYTLISASIGRRPEIEPWEQNATAGARRFWETHALVWTSEAIFCQCCGLKDPLPTDAKQIGDIMVCRDCAENRMNAPTTLRKVPGWGELRVPQR